MSVIKVLDDNLINKIAAGEVVERPSAVVKELVENSIDAGSTQITVEIETGGISFIKISDNGKGIPANDAYSAFTRHATSKISSFEDLEEVLTLGFRGEALASIASVSQVEMITKESLAEVAKKIEINGGKLIKEEDIGANNGTTIIVRNLFFNTPARRKFLKKPATESSYITEVINRLALGNPHISFRYIVNNSEILYTNGNGDLKTVILNILGKDIAKNLIEINFSKDGFGLKGFICKPMIARGNRSYGNFFINGRFIKSEIVQAAIEEAFKTRLPIGKFPIFVLSLSIDPRLVDVNVHPTKLEVRFENEDSIYDICYQSINKALSEEVLILRHEEKEIRQNKILESFKEESYKPHEVQNNMMKDTLDYLYTTKNTSAFVEENYVPYEIKHQEKPVEKTLDKPKLKKNIFFNNYRIIGQFFFTYWLIQQGNSVYLIDQHAAHERILYEEMYNKLKNEKVNSQRLLQPIVFDFSDKERVVVEDNFDLFEEFGFELLKLDDEKYVLNAVPFIFKDPLSSDFFMDIVDKLSSIENSIDNIYDTKFHTIVSMACKKAVKGNDKLNFIEARELIERMLNLENPFTCPHGRPTIVEITRTEIEKMFKRI